MKAFKHGSRTHQKWGVRLTLLILMEGFWETYNKITEEWEQKEFEEFTQCFNLNSHEEIATWLDENKEYFQEEYLKLSKPE